MYQRTALLIFLLFLLVTPLIFTVYTIVEQQCIEFAMEKALEEDNLETVQVAAADIVWLKLHKEALVNGKMFDVKTIQQNGQQLTLTGLFDTREEHLHKKLQSHYLHRSRSGTAKTTLLLLLFAGYHEQHIALHIDGPQFIFKKGSSAFKAASHYDAFSEVTSPPPRYSHLFFS